MSLLAVTIELKIYLTSSSVRSAYNVEIEPPFQLLSSETFPIRSTNSESDDDTRLDIYKCKMFRTAANRCMCIIYFNVKVIVPLRKDIFNSLVV